MEQQLKLQYQRNDEQWAQRVPFIFDRCWDAFTALMEKGN